MLVAVCLFAMMLVPATVAIALTARRHRWRDVSRMLSLKLRRPRRRALVQSVLAVGVFVAIGGAGLVVATAAGVYHPAWPHGWVPVLLLFVSAVLSLPLYLGEEIGWQGYMLPRLLRFGTARGIASGGVLWGLWHLPMTALGGSYPGHSPAVAIPAAVVSAVGIGAVIALIRLRTDSVWPAVAAHLGLNEFALPLTRFFAEPGHVPDPLFAGPLSITTWPVLAAAVILLAFTTTRRLRRSTTHPGPVPVPT